MHLFVTVIEQLLSMLVLELKYSSKTNLKETME